MKMYRYAPLPFQGQKRRFVSEFINVLNGCDDDAVFVDLFGGSGLLSHVAKRTKPNARVVYNDFDGFSLRLKNIDKTNALLREIRCVVGNSVPRNARIEGELKDRVVDVIRRADVESVVDYVTLSCSLLFAQNYRMNFSSFVGEMFYNKICRTDYSLASDYLDGLEVVSCDYVELIERFSVRDNVIFIVDPPYLNTDVSTYNMPWSFVDYLDVLRHIVDRRFIYFTSDRTCIVDFCKWLGRYGSIGDVLGRCEVRTTKNNPTPSARYTDIMLYNLAV